MFDNPLRSTDCCLVIIFLFSARSHLYFFSMRPRISAVLLLLALLPAVCESTSDCDALARTGIFATGTVSPNCCNQTLYSALFECDSSQHIVQLMLNSNSLTGDLPPSLGELTWLLGLDMSGNYLTGRLTVLTNLTRLTFLRLSVNKFDGNLDALVRATFTMSGGVLEP